MEVTALSLVILIEFMAHERKLENSLRKEKSR